VKAKSCMRICRQPKRNGVLLVVISRKSQPRKRPSRKKRSGATRSARPIFFNRSVGRSESFPFSFASQDYRFNIQPTLLIRWNATTTFTTPARGRKSTGRNPAVLKIVIEALHKATTSCELIHHQGLVKRIYRFSQKNSQERAVN
jgi:hypothetical protein